MSKWVTRFQDHSIHGVLSALGPQVVSARDRAKQNADDLELLDRVDEVLQFVVRTLASADPVVVAPATLNALQAQLQAAANEVTAYVGNGNSAHLTNANNNMDNVVQHLAAVPGVRTIDDVEALRDAVASVRKSVAQHNRYLEDQYSGLTQKFGALNTQIAAAINTIDTQKGRLDTAISTFQQQFSEAESKRVADATGREQQQTQNLVSTLAEFKEQFEADAAEFDDRFTTFMREVDGRQKEVFASLDTSVAALRSDLAGQARGVLDELQKNKERAEALLSAITMTGNVAGFQRVANQERTAARVWQGVAVFAMVGLIGFAIVAFQELLTAKFNWGVFAARALVLVAFGILSAYGARQADKHETVERYNRRLELELASIHPFLADLPQEMQHEIKRELASRMFGNQQPSQPTPKEVTGTALDVARLAVNTAAELAKKG